MEVLGIFLFAGAILCLVGFCSLIKDKNTSEKDLIVLIVLCLLMGVSGYKCLYGDEEEIESDDNLPQHDYNERNRNVNFGHGNGFVREYTVSAFKWGGIYACEVEIKSKDGKLYAFPNGSTQAHEIYLAPYNAPGTYYIYWSGEPIYF